jgi:hypothetical protein
MLVLIVNAPVEAPDRRCFLKLLADPEESLPFDVVRPRGFTAFLWFVFDEPRTPTGGPAGICIFCSSRCTAGERSALVVPTGADVGRILLLTFRGVLSTARPFG